MSRAALAEEPQPIGEVMDANGAPRPMVQWFRMPRIGEKLYAHPARTLTDEEIDEAWRSVTIHQPYEQYRIAVARAIEARVRGEK